MDTFDRIIKEKLEKQQYAYKSSAWKNFCRMAGIKQGLTVLQVVGIFAFTGIIFGGIWLWIDATRPSEVEPTEINQPIYEVSDAEEEYISELESNSISDSGIITIPEPSRSISVVVPKSQKEDSASNLAVPIQKEKPSPELQTKEGKWQISIINPDTIKEN